MIQRQRLKFSPQAWVRPLSLYWNGRVWGDVWRQSRRFRWPSLAMEVAFLWLLGLLGGSFVLLQASHYQYFWVPPGLLQGGQGLANLLSLPVPGADQQGLGLGLVLALAMVTWLCWVAGAEKLRLMIAIAYQGAPSRRTGWAKRFLPWAIALILLVMVSLVIQLSGGGIDSGSVSGPISGSVSGSFGDTAQAELPARQARMPPIMTLGRWLLAVAITSLGLALIYRLSPRPWLRGWLLWPGVGLTLGLGIGLLSLGQWGLGWLQTSAIAHGLFLALGIRLIGLYLWILLVPLGAQFNASATAHRNGPGSFPGGGRMAAPPPSFDSFKIKRRSDS